jgi:glycosyltransferase involved in cell wall biosynthesis
VPPRDAEAIAEAVLALRAEPQWARALGRNGRARVERLYTWARVAADTERIYRQTFAARGIPAHVGQAAAR